MPCKLVGLDALLLGLDALLLGLDALLLRLDALLLGLDALLLGLDALLLGLDALLLGLDLLCGLDALLLRLDALLDSPGRSEVTTTEVVHVRCCIGPCAASSSKVSMSWACAKRAAAGSCVGSAASMAASCYIHMCQQFADSQLPFNFERFCFLVNPATLVVQLSVRHARTCSLEFVDEDRHLFVGGKTLEFDASSGVARSGRTSRQFLQL